MLIELQLYPSVWAVIPCFKASCEYFLCIYIWFFSRKQLDYPISPSGTVKKTHLLGLLCMRDKKISELSMIQVKQLNPVLQTVFWDSYPFTVMKLITLKVLVF